MSTAYTLFATRGIRDVGIDEVIEKAQVAKATLYRHFPSKNDLVLAFLARRERLWTFDFVAAGSASRGATPEDQLLAIFDLFDEWFHREEFEACSFVNVLLEMGADHPAGQAAVGHLATIRVMVAQRAAHAGLVEPEAFAACWHILMKGCIVAAAEGDRTAAGYAKAMAHSLIDRHRPRLNEVSATG